MTIRDKRQEEFAEIGWEKERGILYLCPRFGKCRVGIKIMERMDSPRVLISYPDVNIKKSWIEEFDTLGYNYSNVTFTTHLSLKKHTEERWDLIILDEVHLLSDAQIEEAQKLEGKILALTGTMTIWTERELRDRLGLPVLARYPIEQAIEEGVITDYQITVHKVPLDNIIKSYKSDTRSEKKQFDALSWVLENQELTEDVTKKLRFQRMRIIQGSLAKLKKTRDLLRVWNDQRVLVFCGLTKIADSIGCPVYHSKAGDKEVFDRFAEGIGNHCAVVRIGNTGKTYKPLNKVLVNYFDSNAENLAQKINRCTAMEYDNPEKKADVHLISSNEPVELKWLSNALEFFDDSKIKYV